jgi:hypothetical protein
MTFQADFMIRVFNIRCSMNSHTAYFIRSLDFSEKYFFECPFVPSHELYVITSSIQSFLLIFVFIDLKSKLSG